MEAVGNRNEGAHIVLVHGLGSGAWCWYKVRCLLEASGYKVTCIDLKSAGVDPSTPDSVQSFEEYNQPLFDFFSTHSLSHPHDKLILVGHSAGGLSVTDVTYRFPNKIRAAVYVAATMLKHGFSTPQDFIDGVPEILRSLGSKSSQAPTSEEENREFNRQINYNMSPPEDLTLAMMLHRPAPTNAVVSARFSGSIVDVDQVPRVYIKTLQDRVLKPEQQEAMIKRWPPAHIFVLDSDHNPTFSAPFLLSGFLSNIAKCTIW
ncbi:hypothetical protein Ancab_002076 [Ancistrocladus abbreviatus]